MKRILVNILLFITAGIFTTCDKNFIEREFPSVLTVSVDQRGVEEVIFSGKLISRNHQTVDEVGFIWQKEYDPRLKKGFTANLSSRVQDGPFSLPVYNSLKGNTEYRVRAYAKVNGITVYGEMITFTCDTDYTLSTFNISPLTGQVGDTVSIQGGFFNTDESSNVVKFNDLPAEIVEVTDTSLLCIVPFDLTSKESNINLITDGLVNTMSDTFILTTPTITSFYPATVTFQETVDIYGTGFHRMNEINKVKVGSYEARVDSSTSDYISAIVPFTNDSLCYISVSVSGQEAISASKIKVIAPHFDYFMPVSGDYLDTLTIFYQRVNPATIYSIRFGNLPGRIIKTESDSALVEVPPTLINEYSNIVVEFSNSTYTFETPFRLHQPEITGLSENLVLNFQNLTVYGHGFHPIINYNRVCLKNTTTGYIYQLTPNMSAPDFVIVTISNPAIPGGEIASGEYQVGIKTCENIQWSDKYVNIKQISPWRRLADFPGGARYKGASFSVNGKGYSGFGAKLGNNMQKDLWEYNPATETWKRKSDFPGYGRILPASFQNSAFGFIGGGQSLDNSNQVPFTDFYRFDPATDQWTRIEDAPSVEKSYGAASSSPLENVHVANMVVGSLYEYDSDQDSWSTTYNGPGIQNRNPMVFSINGKVYVVCGNRSVSPYESINEVWEYDPLTNSMTRKGDFPGKSRLSGFSFSIGNYGYIGCGINTTGEWQVEYLSDVYRYDPVSDTWAEIGSFPGHYLRNPTSFVVDDKAYILTGYDGSDILSKVWEFHDIEIPGR